MNRFGRVGTGWSDSIPWYLGNKDKGDRDRDLLLSAQHILIGRSN